MDGQAPTGGSLPGDDGPRVPGTVPGPGDDFDLDEHFAWLVREIDEGRQQAPPESALEGPAISVSLGDASDVDPELLAAMCGPDGLGGEAVSAVFGQDKAADVLRPGPVLAALTAQAAARAGSLTDNELTGALQAARRMANHAAYQQVVVIAEFARRRQAALEAAQAAGRHAGCRDGEFPGEELAMELVTTRADAGARIDAAADLTTRLPRTLAAMEAGTIDLPRACVIAFHTRAMTDTDAAYADKVLAAAAPGKRHEQLARKAAALELKLAPEAVAARKTLARQDQRVEARREESGNASLSGRELDTADVISSKAYIDAIAIQLRSSGLIEGNLGRLRALALVDLTQGRNPLDRIKPPQGTAPADDPASHGPADPAEPTDSGPGDSYDQASALGDRLNFLGPDVPPDRDDGDQPRRGPTRSAQPTPLPAMINLLVPVGTLLGWDTAPAEARGWGLLDADETRTLVHTVASHPRTRWCTTLIAPDGTAIAHGCATGQHPWPSSKGQASRDPSGSADREPRQQQAVPSGTGPPAPSPRQPAQLIDLLRRLNVQLDPIARGACDHSNAENRYVPSRKLKHLIHARSQLCSAPGCNAQAVYCDLDHTVPYPEGPTDQCNLNPKCRRHHRVKQAPGWTVTQPTPDTATWTTPSGRTHTTTPTTYNL